MIADQVETIVKVLAEHEPMFEPDNIRSTYRVRYYCMCGEVRDVLQREVLAHQAVKVLDALGWIQPIAPTGWGLYHP